MSAVEDRDRLEARLEALRAGTPTMPQDVERRVRARIAAEIRRPARIRRTPPRPPSAGGMAGPFLALVLLITLAGWVVTSTVLPVLRSSREKNHCAPAQASVALPVANAAALPHATPTPSTAAAVLMKARATAVDHCTR